MNVLIATTLFSLRPDDPNLVNELADELVRQGHSVTVFCLDWKRENAACDLRPRPGLRVLNTPAAEHGWLPRLAREAAKWSFAAWWAGRQAAAALRGERFDLIVAPTPAVTCWAVVRHFKRRGRAVAYCILWDFFPVHHSEIGLIPAGPARRIAAALESRALRLFDVIGVMSPANLRFLERHHPELQDKVREIIWLWGTAPAGTPPPREAVRRELGLPLDGVLAVFGGQLTAGRGLELLVDLAERARAALPQVAFVIVGGGTAFETLRARIAASGLANVVLLPRVPRARYQQLLQACDIGIVATVPHVSVPTFPSKTVDYLRAGLPVLAATEESTDYGVIIEGEARAGLSSLAGDLDALEHNLRVLATDGDLRAALGRNGRRFFDEHLNVATVCRMITRHAERR